jgi:hypothetical protein
VLRDGLAAVEAPRGVPRGGPGTTTGVLQIPIAILVNAFLAHLLGYSCWRASGSAG